MNEQTTLDLRNERERAATAAMVNAVEAMTEALGSSCTVRNRHEAYGVAAEHLAKISAAAKSVKDDVTDLLTTLQDPNRPAVEAVSQIRNSAETLTSEAIWMAAVMDLVMQSLYSIEHLDSDSEEYTGFEEA